ncbi:MAG: OmpA family protein [Candidatus Aenigmatarchaeota archaeon]
MGKGIYIFIVMFFIFVINGCATLSKSKKRLDSEKIASLEKEIEELRKTKEILEKKLESEIKDNQIKLNVEEKGLIITIVAEVLFDSGKAVLKKESLPILDKVAKVFTEEIPQYNISIEGHTDNQPIRYSGWKSNWELSSHRALSVLHYLEEKGVEPKRLSAVGYGEYHPIASNETPEGMRLNRRVEIIVLPNVVKKIEKKYLEGEIKESKEELK